MTDLDLDDEMYLAEMGVLVHLCRARDLKAALMLAAGAGLNFRLFSFTDTRAILFGLAFSVSRRKSRVWAVRNSLVAVNAWDDDDNREHVARHSAKWGPGPLGVLLSRIEYDETRMLRKLGNLIEAVRVFPFARELLHETG